jgi:hypothetical protein
MTELKEWEVGQTLQRRRVCMVQTGHRTRPDIREMWVECELISIFPDQYNVRFYDGRVEAISRPHRNELREVQHG